MLESERALVGAILTDPGSYHAVAEIVSEGDFADPACGRLFGRLGEVIRSGSEADTTVVADRWPELLPAALAAELLGRPHMARTYAEQIVRGRRLRNLRRELHACMSECAEPSADIAAIVARISTATADALTERHIRMRNIREVALEVVRDMDARQQAKQEPGISSGIPKLDVMTGGWEPGRLYVVAGRPGGGKSALMLHFARAAAYMREKMTVIVSLEMPGVELAGRIISAEGGVSGDVIKFGGTVDDWQRVHAALQKMANDCLWADERECVNVTQIASLAQQHRARYGLDLLLVDYAQIIDPTDKNEIRERQIAESVVRLKQLAKNMRIPIILLAQLGRDYEKRENKTPRLSDLRESGSIEANADMVLMLHQETKPAVDEYGREEVEFHIAKNRGGPTGIVCSWWHKPTHRFSQGHEKLRSVVPSVDAWRDRL